MITYSVFIYLKKVAESDWLNFIKQKHIEEVMNTGCFIEYKFQKQIESDNEDEVNFRIDYYLKNMDKMNEYIEIHSTALKQDVLDRFGGYFRAERRIYEHIE